MPFFKKPEGNKLNLLTELSLLIAFGTLFFTRVNVVIPPQPITPLAIYKDICHVLVGVLFGVWLGTRDWLFAFMFWFLVGTELYVALDTRGIRLIDAWNYLQQFIQQIPLKG